MQELTMQELAVVFGGTGHTVVAPAARTTKTTSTLTVAKDPGDRN